VLLDANVVLLAVDVDSPYHDKAAGWLDDARSGARRVAFPRQTIGAFLGMRPTRAFSIGR
jgi:predicted nucleic acid-binding protein